MPPSRSAALSEPRLPSRLPVARRLGMRAGYMWRNSGAPAVTLLRRHWDVRGPATMPAIRSELGGMSVTYAGLADGEAYTLQFTEQRRQTGDKAAPFRDAGTVLGRDLVRVDRLPDADLLIVGTTSAKVGRLPAESSFVLPMRVHFVVDFDDEVDRVLARIVKGEQRNLRQKFRQHQWELAIERDPGWFDYFYDHIYRATMFKRHGERERTEEREAAYECLFRDGILFVLDMDGKRIGGHLCHWNPKSGVLTSRLLGVLDGADEYYAAGALKAMHYLLIQWAGRNGVRRLDFQGTEAFLSKGTYQLKRLFGTRVILPPNHFGDKRLWLQVRRDTPGVRDFLAANPFLSIAGDGTMEAIYFHDDDRPARTDYNSKSPGVTAKRHLSLDEFFAAGQVRSFGGAHR